MTEQSKAYIQHKAHLQVSLTVPCPKISLSPESSSTRSLQLIVTARLIDSSRPTSPITLCTDASVLDNGQHERQDGLFIGAFLALQSTTDPHRTICLAFLGSPNYGSQPDASLNLRERAWMRFETVPALGKGELIVTHNLSLDRIFQYSRYLKGTDIQPGEKFRIRMNPKRLFWAGWWTFGSLDDEDDEDGGLAGKKFAKWERPDEKGEIGNLMVGEEQPDVEQMEREGWVFSQGFDDLEVTQDEAADGVVVEFTK